MGKLLCRATNVFAREVSCISIDLRCTVKPVLDRVHIVPALVALIRHLLADNISEIIVGAREILSVTKCLKILNLRNGQCNQVTHYFVCYSVISNMDTRQVLDDKIINLV